MRMRKGWYIVLSLLLVSCSEAGKEADVPEGRVSFAMALQPSLPVTRSSDVVAQTGGVFRGMARTALIPFGTAGAVQNNSPRLGYCGQLNAIQSLSGSDHTLLKHLTSLPRDTRSFLFYGEASPLEGGKAVNGSLLESGFETLGSSGNTPAGIRFSPDPIGVSATAASAGAAMAEYLDEIASVEGFRETYPDIFDDFTNSGRVMSGSSAQVTRLVNRLYNLLAGLNASTVRDALFEALLSHGVVRQTGSYQLPAAMQNRPGEGLPEGACGLRWNGAHFVTGEEPGIALFPAANYCYPASLWYYGNSVINTTENIENTYEHLSSLYTTKGWEELKGLYEHAPGQVSSTTVGVILVNPVQYGVGLFSLKVKQVEGSLRDSKNREVSVLGQVFPLTGLILGSQKQLDFSFSPVEAEGVEEYASYDTQFGRQTYLSSSEAAQAVHSLVVETEADEAVRFALEFRNDSGAPFYGANGRVYPGSHFYLLGELNVADGAQPAGENIASVFKKDHTTTVQVIISSLREAYNVMPELEENNFRIGVQAQFAWMLSDPSELELN